MIIDGYRVGLDGKTGRILKMLKDSSFDREACREAAGQPTERPRDRVEEEGV